LLVYVGRLGIKGVVGVLGGAETAFSRAPLKEGKDRIAQQAYELGKRLAELQSVHLLTGGGGGVMKAVSEGFYSVHPRGGLILGIIPTGKKTAEYPNEWVEVPIFTPLSDDPKTDSCRTQVSLLTSDIIIVLPGDKTTLGEVELAAKDVQKPLGIYLDQPTDSIGGKKAEELGKAYSVLSTIDEVIHFVHGELAKK
jgi:uncharacterized protein (TIGR00725 family)